MRGQVIIWLALVGAALALAACAPTDAGDTGFKPQTTTNSDFTLPAVEFPVGNFPVSMAVADYDVDTRVDIAVMHMLDAANTIHANIVLYTQTAPLVFSETPFDLGSNPGQVGFANLDGNATLDLWAIINSDKDPELWFCLNPPACTGERIILAGNPKQVRIADLDGLGGADDLVMTITGTDEIHAFMGPLAAGATPVITQTVEADGITVINGPGSFALGDFNGDTKPDIAVSHLLSKIVSVWLGDGSGGFTRPATFKYTLDYTPADIAVGNFTADADLDIVLSASGATGADSDEQGRVVLLTGVGGGTGTFAEPAINITVGKEPRNIIVGDFDTDAFTMDEFFLLHSQHSSVSFINQPAITPPLLEGTGIAVTDKPFAAVTGTLASGAAGLDLAVLESEKRAISILDGDGAGGFTRTVIGLEHSTRFPVVADLDGTGLNDLIVMQPTEDRLLFLLNPGLVP